MDLMTRYLFRQTASALFMILITLTLIVWLATALKQLILLTNQGQSFWIFMKITSLAIPNLIAVVAPVALLIAALHTLNRINSDSELIVFTAAGAPIWRLLRPFLYLGIVVMLFTLAVNAYVLPKSMQLLKDYITQVRADVISQVLQPGQFTNPDPGLTFHIRDRSNNGELLGLLVHDERDVKRPMTYIAERAQIVEQNGRSFLIMHQGHIHRQQAGSAEINIVSFESYLFDLAQLTASNKAKPQANYKPRELYLTELLNPDTSNPEYVKNPKRFAAELHERLSSALYPVLFVLLAVVHLGQARTTREGRMESVVMAFTVATVLRVIGLAAANMAAKKSWAIAVMYGVPLLGIVAALMMLALNIKPLKLPAIALPSLSWPWTSRARQNRDATVPVSRAQAR